MQQNNVLNIEHTTIELAEYWAYNNILIWILSTQLCSCLNIEHTAIHLSDSAYSNTVICILNMQQNKHLNIGYSW